VVIYGNTLEEKFPFIYNVKDKDDIHGYGKKLAWVLKKRKKDRPEGTRIRQVAVARILEQVGGQRLEFVIR
jgi:hypothetical protein